MPETLRRVYLAARYAKGDDPRRFMLNRELVRIGLDLRSGGLTTDQWQRMMREARLQATGILGRRQILLSSSASNRTLVCNDNRHPARALSWLYCGNEVCDMYRAFAAGALTATG